MNGQCSYSADCDSVGELDRHTFVSVLELLKFHKLISCALKEGRRIWLQENCGWYLDYKKDQARCGRFVVLDDDFEAAIKKIEEAVGKSGDLSVPITMNDRVFVSFDSKKVDCEAFRERMVRLLRRLKDVGAIMVLENVGEKENEDAFRDAFNMGCK